MSDTEQRLVLCNEPSPFPHTGDCPRERGHDGEHYYWFEGKITGTNRYGVTVKTFDSIVVYHLLMEGDSIDQLGVGALVALFEYVRDPDESA